jgi:hypothetical protein
MKGHLTKGELIQYQFKLVSDIYLEEIAGHLQACAECRRHLEQLRRKFAALDLLREDVRASQDLISRVIEQAAEKPHVKRGAKPVSSRVERYLAPPFRRGLPWLGAAAVLLVGLLFLVTYLNRQAPERPTDLAEKEIAPVVAMEKKTPIIEESVALAAKASEPEGYLSGAAGGAADRAAISEDIPFAPASAIELVTLPRREDVQITIYNSADLTLVRERRNLTLKKGWNWLQFMWANTLIDPTSLSLEPLQEADKIDVQQLVFPPRLRELGRWLIRSEVSGRVPFQITYFTSGLSWRAFYMGTLSQGEKTMRLDGYVRVGNNSGEDYENAQTRLIVGKVHLLDQIAELAKRPYPYGVPMPLRGLGYGGAFGGAGAAITNGDALDHYRNFSGRGNIVDELGRKEIRKEGLSEYFLYTIEGTETIPDKWGKRLLSFEAEDIAVKSLYKYDEERWGEQTIRFVSFANDKKHNLGDTPIPNGTVRIYSQADEQGYLSYVGGTDIKYIPVDEEVELNLGPARLVGAEPILMDFKTDNYVFDGKKNVAGWDEICTWKVEVANTRALPIDIEITRGFGTACWTLQLEDKDVSYEKYDATHARFKLTLQPRSKQSFGYRVRTYHGTREEVLTKQREGSDYEQ